MGTATIVFHKEIMGTATIVFHKVCYTFSNMPRNARVIMGTATIVFHKVCYAFSNMPRNARVDVADEFYHVINRANGRLQIFQTPEDYRIFEQLLEEAVGLTGMRLFAYTTMPNHWHLVVSPRADGDLGLFMHRLCNTHTRKVHAFTNTNGSGHLYQGRYKSFWWIQMHTLWR